MPRARSAGAAEDADDPKPQIGLVAHGYGVTRPSGGATDLTANLVFNAGVAPDTDGLPDAR